MSSLFSLPYYPWLQTPAEEIIKIKYPEKQNGGNKNKCIGEPATAVPILPGPSQNSIAQHDNRQSGPDERKGKSNLEKKGDPEHRFVNVAERDDRKEHEYQEAGAHQPGQPSGRQGRGMPFNFPSANLPEEARQGPADRGDEEKNDTKPDDDIMQHWTLIPLELEQSHVRDVTGKGNAHPAALVLLKNQLALPIDLAENKGL